MSRYYDYFAPSKPKEAKGGIKAQSKRGDFGKSWWAKRWISVLESFNIGARLGRGRSYARNGQVLSVVINKGLAEAKVQGSRSRPYSISIKVKTLTSSDWKKLATRVSQQALYAAKLLAGEMPQDIENVFKEIGLSLFPAKVNDLETDCSCPDWSNPCKHIAAVYYLLGEEFDRDPFLLFNLRGMSREEFLEILGHDFQLPVTPSMPGEMSKPAESLPPEPLAEEAEFFWNGGRIPNDLFGEVKIPSLPAALPKRLGNFPFWRGKIKFQEAIEPVYTAASQRGFSLFLGELLIFCHSRVYSQ